MSSHFQYSGTVPLNNTRNFDDIDINLISVPSIFYGSSIKKGSIDLKFYVTGTLVAQAKDIRRNGELIQTGPAGSDGSGSVVGLALYTEGFLLLTSSVDFSPHVEKYPPSGIAVVKF